MSYTIKQVCEEFGITRQGYYKMQNKAEKESLNEEIILEMVRRKRKILVRSGGKKIYYLIKPEMNAADIKIGRDKFFDILRENGLLVKKKLYRVKTTNSNHPFRKYNNLIKGLRIERINQVYVSDITYLKTREGFCYLSLVTDMHSRKIVGYSLSKSLSFEGALEALQRALEGKEDLNEMIHHSDRGIQYCSKKYTELLTNKGVKISMSEQGNPYENAIAERVNGILKDEFLLNQTFNSFQIAKKSVTEAINIYNTVRPHLSLGYLTPEQKYAA